MPPSASTPLSISTTPLKDAAFIEALTINGKTVHRPEAHRALLDPKPSNDSVTSNETYLPTGQLNVVDNPKGGGTDTEGNGAKTTIDYYSETDSGDLVSLSIALSSERSLPSQNEKAVPPAPALAVRPMRCT